MKEWVVVLHKGEFIVRKNVSPRPFDFRLGFFYGLKDGFDFGSFGLGEGELCAFAVFSNLQNYVRIHRMRFEQREYLALDIKYLDFVTIGWEVFEGVQLNDDADAIKFIDYAMEKGFVFEENSNYKDGYTRFMFQKMFRESITMEVPRVSMSCAGGEK